MNLLPPLAATATSSLPISSSSINHYLQKPHQYKCNNPHQYYNNQFKLNRRSLTLTLFPFLLFPISPSYADEPPHLELYIDSKEGFIVLIPSSWNKVEKAGATVLFEEGKGNSIGVVVTPVKLSSLSDFGTPQFVADKLIAAERRKESTKDAKVIAVAERSGHGGLPIYEFEYSVDSTRGGLKRIFSGAFVASKKLYLLNIAYSDRPDNPLNSETRMVLEQVLHSFDTTL